LYGARNRGQDWIDIAGRLTEHTGGIAKAIRQRQDLTELRKRIADVFAWTIAVWNSVRAYGVSRESSFADIIFDKYPNACPRCHKRACECPRPIARAFISSVMRGEDSQRLRDAVAETCRNLSTILRHRLREFTEQPSCTAPRT
jgi:NTP pyrophosphatase (non-canonical NTP hydrolase)